MKFSVGDRVLSDSYGEGVINEIEDRGDKRILIIRFKDRTAKFIEAFAKLQKL